MMKRTRREVLAVATGISAITNGEPISSGEISRTPSESEMEYQAYMCDLRIEFERQWLRGEEARLQAEANGNLIEEEVQPG